MNRLILKSFLFLMPVLLYAAKAPMESISRYNVILVHGAGDSLGGMDCDRVDYDPPYDNRDVETGLPHSNRRQGG